MPKTRIETGRQVAAHLNEFEMLLDQALAKGAEFLATLPAARVQARLAAQVGQDAIEQFVASVSRVSEARRSVVEGHRCLEQTRLQLNLPVYAGGDKIPLPEPGGALEQQETALRIVR